MHGISQGWLLQVKTSSEVGGLAGRGFYFSLWREFVLHVLSHAPILYILYIVCLSRVFTRAT